MKQRNYSIDILKFICAVLVVFLHTNFKWHDLILPFTRCAVPCFLMISGFLLYSGDGIGQERLRRNIKHILYILLWSTLLFVAYKEVMSIIQGALFIPSLRQWLFFLIFNENPFAGHLWYLGAYFYVLLIMLIVDKHKLWKYMLWVTPLLLMGDLLFGKYSILLLGKEFPFVYVRNFLFVGIPYFMLGIWCKMHLDKLMRFNGYIYSGGVILFTLTSILEKTVLLDLGKSPMREHYLSTTFLAICLFMFVFSFKNIHCSRISQLGERDSLYIYVFHQLFVMTLPMIISVR
ncbi:MAG: acyltransferase [Prevotellaceae bacterium]|nr:acyltransferase [Prevotellaceae bacterium]